MWYETHKFYILRYCVLRAAQNNLVDDIDGDAKGLGVRLVLEAKDQIPLSFVTMVANLDPGVACKLCL